MGRRGFTVVEILVSMAIVGLVTLVGFGSLSRGRSQAGAQGLSMAFADVFRQARQEALARRRPVAVMLPSANGTKANVSAYYILEGEVLPQITRVRDYATEYRGAQAFVGTWPLSGASAATLTSTLTMPGSKWSTFNLSNWLPPASANDFAFCYLPDGTLRTNGLKLFDGSYHLAITAGVAYTGSAPNFQLTKAGSSFTLVLSPAGAVTIESGLASQDGSIETSGSFSTSPAASPPSTTSLALQNPTFVQEPRIFPQPDPALLPPGINATLTKDQFLSLESVARSPSGHPLYCKWQVVGVVPPAGPGSYSFQGNGGRMLWDPLADGGNGAWKSIWQWRPPPTAEPNDVYHLQCVVQNYGGTPLAAQIKDIKIVPPGNVFFETNRSGTPEIWSMNENGSRQQIYLTGASQPSANLDGTRLVFIRGGDIFLQHPVHPGAEIQLTTGGGFSIPCLSPNGTKVAFRRQNGGNYELRVMRVSSTGYAANALIEANSPTPGPGWLRPGGTDTERLAWSPDGRSLLYTKADGNVYKADIGNGAGGNPTFSGPAALYMHCQPSGENPIWNPSWGVNNRIYYSINNTSATALYDPYIFYANAPATGTIGTWNWGRDSYNLEQIMCERDPGGGNLILTVEQAVPYSNPDRSQIVKVDTNVPMGFTIGPPPRVPLTSTPGYNTRPCWTK